MSSLKLLDSPHLRDTRWSISVAASDGTVLMEKKADDLLATASLAKVFLLAEVASQIESTLLDPGQLVARPHRSRVAGSGIWQHMRAERLPLGDVATLVGALSDNWATNALLGVVGLPALQDLASRHAPGGSVMMDRVRDYRGPHDQETLSVGTAGDWQRIFLQLGQGSFISPNVSEMVRSWLRNGVDLSMVASALNLDPLDHGESEKPLSCFNKTGTDPGVRADCGFFTGEFSSVAYAVICNWDETGNPRGKDSVMAAMRAIGSTLRDYCSSGRI